MGVHIPAGYGQVSMDCSLTGNLRVMTMTIGTKTTAGQTPSQLADAVFGQMTSTGRPWHSSIIPSGWQTGPFRATIQGIGGVESGVGLLVGGGTATAGNSLPPNCAYLLRKRTLVGGRRGQGRMFEPPMTIPETVIDTNGIIQPTIVTERNGRWVAFLAGLVGVNLDAQLFHAESLDPIPIQSIVMQSLLATQRRRMRS